jgi:hypothetical protein
LCGLYFFDHEVPDVILVVCRNDVASHRSSTSGTNIVGDILYNIAVGDEEGRSRQRILAFAAKRYAMSTS